MIIGRSERQKNRDMRRNEFQQFSRKRDKVVDFKTDAIRRQYAGIEDKLRDLHEQRQGLLETPLPRSEFKKATIEGFRAAKERAKGLVLKHLLHCQEINWPPFERDQKIIPENQYRNLVYLALSEKDLNDVYNQLPTNGLSAAERDQKISDIDKQIETLKAKLDAEMDAAGKAEATDI